MLYRVWGLNTYSVYSDFGDLNDLSVAELTGHRSLGRPFGEAYEQLTASNQVYYVKTHEIPIDRQRAIYVVRDGRTASRSYCHYRREFNGLTDERSNLRDILLGFTPYGSWSNHLDAWDPMTRPGTLLLKYEQLLEEPAGQIARLAEFLGVEPRRSWRNSFDSLAQVEPRFFRAAGANRPAAALQGPDAELFWAIHGPWMRRLGYATPDDGAAIPEMSATVRNALYHAVADVHGHIGGLSARVAHLEEALRESEEEVHSARQRCAEFPQSEEGALTPQAIHEGPRRAAEISATVAQSV
jgi:hypothetical protein